MKFLTKRNLEPSRLVLPALPPGAHEIMVPYSVIRGRNKYANQLSAKETRKQTLIGIGIGIGIMAVVYGIVFFPASALHLRHLWFPWWGINALQLSFMLLLTFPLIAAPSHLQIGAQGIRFHFLKGFGIWSTGWIGWDCISQIKSKRPGMGFYKKKAIDVTINLNRVPPRLRRTVRLLACALSAQHWSRDQVTLRIDAHAITHEADAQNFVKALEHFAGEDQLDISVARLGGDKNAPTYTKLWLDKLEDTGTAKRDLNPLAAGDCLNNNQFRILERIAAGGQAITYLAERVDAAKTIADRFLSADAARARKEQSIFDADAQGESDQDKSDQDKSDLIVLKEFVLPIRGGIEIRRKALENVQHEVLLLEKLNHPQIVKLIDFFVDSQRAYIAMEYIDGKSLRRLVADNGRFSEAQVVDFALQMCTLLTYLHSQEPPVLHRDFTPDNLLLRQDGKLCLIDFNVAEQLVSDCTRTVVGKHCYVSPEQFRGQATQQSDVYSLGATLFWLAAGEDPEPITASHPRTVNDTLSIAFDVIVAKSTAPDGGKRYHSAADLEKDLLALHAVAAANN